MDAVLVADSLIASQEVQLKETENYIYFIQAVKKLMVLAISINVWRSLKMVFILANTVVILW